MSNKHARVIKSHKISFMYETVLSLGCVLNISEKVLQSLNLKETQGVLKKLDKTWRVLKKFDINLRNSKKA